MLCRLSGRLRVGKLTKLACRGSGGKAAIGLEAADHTALLVDRDQQAPSRLVLQIGDQASGLGGIENIIALALAGEKTIKEDDPAEISVPNILDDRIIFGQHRSPKADQETLADHVVQRYHCLHP